MASIRQRGDRWQARVTLDGQTVTKSFFNKMDAQKWARQQQVDMERGIFKQPQPPISLAELLERYISEVLPQKRGYQQELYMLRGWKGRPVAKLKLQDIQPSDIALARDARLKEVAPGSVRRELDALSSVFTYAKKEWALCQDNPVTQIRKPPHARARERRLLPQELMKIVSASQAPDFAAIVWLAYETAMRRGEILSLRWEHIDLQRRVAHLPITKNGDSRDVPLSKAAIALLEQLPRCADGLVFIKNPTSLSGAFQRAVERARVTYLKECSEQGLTPDPKFLVDVRLHDLRHAATTRFVERGLSILEVSAITGHKTLSMLKRYSHPDPTVLASKLD